MMGVRGLRSQDPLVRRSPLGMLTRSRPFSPVLLDARVTRLAHQPSSTKVDAGPGRGDLVPRLEACATATKAKRGRRT